MKTKRTYEELMQQLNAALAANTTDTVDKPATTSEYTTAFWDGMHTGVLQNILKEGSDGSGGYLVPDTFEEKLVQGLSEENILRRIGRIVNTTHDLHIPTIRSKGMATWVEEGKPWTFTDVEYGRITLNAHKLAASIMVSDELLADSAECLENYIEQVFCETMGACEEESFLCGNGTDRPLGLIHQAPVGAVSKTENIIDMDDMLDLLYSVKAPYRKNAVWLLSESAYIELRKTKTHNGKYVWQPSATENEPEMLFGYPVFTTKHLGNTVSGEKTALFGDFGYYWISDRNKRSIKRLSERFADRGMVAFVATQRVDAKLVLPEAIKALEIK